MRVQSNKQIVQHIIKGTCNGEKEYEESVKFYGQQGFTITKERRVHDTFYLTFTMYIPFVRVLQELNREKKK